MDKQCQNGNIVSLTVSTAKSVFLNINLPLSPLRTRGKSLLMTVSKAKSLVKVEENVLLRIAACYKKTQKSIPSLIEDMTTLIEMTLTDSTSAAANDATIADSNSVSRVSPIASSSSLMMPTNQQQQQQQQPSEQHGN
jgi:hypothetical protein